MPDVCQTPAPPAGPVPIPYPNMAQLATADASTCSMKVLVESQPVHHVATEIPMSNGDEPGVNGGVISGGQLGVCKRLGWSRPRAKGLVPKRVWCSDIPEVPVQRAYGRSREMSPSRRKRTWPIAAGTTSREAS